MRSENFIYWLQGIFEGNDIKTLDEKQVQTIKNHLKLVFLYDIDPSYGDNEVLQHIMQNVHDGKDPMYGVKASLKEKTNKPNRSRPNNGQVIKC